LTQGNPTFITWTELITYWLFTNSLPIKDFRANFLTEHEELKEKNPEGYQQHPSTKFLNNINEFIFRRIPEYLSAPEFRQGKTLGTDKKHWFRSKFNRRFRLFFRYSSTEKVIIYSWINDENSLS
jgi:plasmid maintenance system killer protein